MWKAVTFYYEIEIREAENFEDVIPTLDFFPSLLQNYWNDKWYADVPLLDIEENHPYLKQHAHHLSIMDNKMVLVESFYVNDGYKIDYNEEKQSYDVTEVDDEQFRAKVSELEDRLGGAISDGWGEGWEQHSWEHNGEKYYAHVGNLLCITVQIGEYSKIKVKSVDEIKNLRWFQDCEYYRKYKAEKKSNDLLIRMCKSVLKNPTNLTPEQLEESKKELQECLEKENGMNWVYAHKDMFLHKWGGEDDV